MYAFKTTARGNEHRRNGSFMGAKYADGYVRLLAEMIQVAVKDSTHKDLRKRRSARAYIFDGQGKAGWTLADAVSRINGRIRALHGRPGGLSVGDVQKLARERIQLQGQKQPAQDPITR